MVPAVLIAFFAVTLLQGSAALLGLAANAMFFTVGWHYAKQGFGILMLDAAYKGVAFDARERRNLLVNTHLSWVTLYLWVNNAVAAKHYRGLTYYAFDTPDALLWTMAALTAASLVVVAWDILRKWARGRILPLNGVIAYVSAVYVWLVLARFDPILMLVVPAFHSLQYLGVVWRRQINVERQRAREGSGVTRARTRPAARWLQSTPFGVGALRRRRRAAGRCRVLVGAGVPRRPRRLRPGAIRCHCVPCSWARRSSTSTTISSTRVIWRRENADTRRYLFEA